MRSDGRFGAGSNDVSTSLVSLAGSGKGSTQYGNRGGKGGGICGSGRGGKDGARCGGKGGGKLGGKGGGKGDSKGGGKGGGNCTEEESGATVALDTIVQARRTTNAPMIKRTRAATPREAMKATSVDPNNALVPVCVLDRPANPSVEFISDGRDGGSNGGEGVDGEGRIGGGGDGSGESG